MKLLQAGGRVKEKEGSPSPRAGVQHQSVGLGSNLQTRASLQSTGGRGSACETVTLRRAQTILDDTRQVHIGLTSLQTISLTTSLLDLSKVDCIDLL